MAAAVARENMEEGELSSGSEDEGGLGGYTPLERPVNPKPHFQPKTQTQDYDSDSPPPRLPESESDSDDDKPSAKTARPAGPWGRRGALVVEDGGGETFQMMAQAFQAGRDQKGLNKKKNNVWGSVVQEESIADSIADFGVGRQLKDLGSDRGAETYDFTLIAKERQEERRRQRKEEKVAKNSCLDSEMDSYWSKGREEREDEASDGEEKVEETEAMQEEAGETGTEPRGTKRSVKERLGAKRMVMDRFRNETLPAPGEPRQIVDIGEMSLVEGTDEEFGEELAERLKEDKEEMMVELVRAVGRRVAWHYFQQTQKVEREGGMVINNGARRRTPGGVMLHLLRTKPEEPEVKEKLKKFFNDSQKSDRRKILNAKKRKQKDFDKEMSEFLTARKELSEIKEAGAMEEDGGAAPYGESDGECDGSLAPLPNVLSMIASSIGGAAVEEQAPQENKKPSVQRVSSFKEPEAPPNSVERQDRLSPVSREERALLDYDEDDFLATTNDSEEIELF